MESARGSESHPVRQMRPSLTGGFLRRHRHRTQPGPTFCRHPENFPGRNREPEGSRGSPSSCPRRQRCTECVVLTVGDKAQQENKRVLSLRLEPATPQTAAETHRLAPRPFPPPSGSNRPSTFHSVVPRARQFSATARSVTAVCTAPAYPFGAAAATTSSGCATSEVDSGKSPVAPTARFSFRPLAPRSTNGVTPVVERCRSGAAGFSTGSAPRKPRPRIKLPSVKSAKAKGSETTPSGSASPPSLPSTSSVPPRFPAIFNVGHADLAPGVDTCTTATVGPTRRDNRDNRPRSVSKAFSATSPPPPPEFLFPSFDALDDLTRWGGLDIDMDPFQSFLTSTDSPEQGNDRTNQSRHRSSNNNNHASTSAQSNDSNSNPFSTPFGEDDLLQDEIPFPTTRHRVVIENMGVKKSKTMAVDKARLLTGSSLGFGFPTASTCRRFVHPFMASDSSAPPAPPANTPATTTTTTTTTMHQRPPPHLPHPLPLTQGADSPNPLKVVDSVAQTSTYLLHPSESNDKKQQQQTAAAMQRTPDPLPSSPPASSLSTSPAPTAVHTAGMSETGRRERPKRTPNLAPSLRSQMASGGCHHLGPEDCELLIMFPRTAHYEVWDMDDHGCVSVPAMVFLMAKDPRRWHGTPLAMPDVSLVELTCEDRALPVPFSSLCPPRRTLQQLLPVAPTTTTTTTTTSSSSRAPPPSSSSPTELLLLPGDCRWSAHTYSTSFVGGQSALDDDDDDDDDDDGGRSKRGKGVSMLSALKKREEEQAMKRDRISLDGKWVRTQEWPGVVGLGRGGDATFHLGRRLLPSSSSTSTSTSKVVSPKGWYLRFWVPIPTRLFMKRETRIFRICAKVWMMMTTTMDEDDREKNIASPDPFGEEEDQAASSYLFAEAEMTVSHLRKQRELGR